MKRALVLILTVAMMMTAGTAFAEGRPGGRPPMMGQIPADAVTGATPGMADGQQPPEKPEGEAPADGQQPPEKPEGEAPTDGQQPPEKPEGEAPTDGQQPPEKPEGEAPTDGQQPPEKPEGEAPADGQQPPEGGTPAEGGLLAELLSAGIITQAEYDAMIAATAD